MIFQVFTIFPEMFPGVLQYSLAGKALQNGIWSLETINIRDYAIGKHSKVDDTPYGGGAGMIMRPDVLGNAIEDVVDSDTQIIYMSPRGKKLTQKYISTLANHKKLAIICGRFEGVDERVLQEYNIHELSIGDYVLSGGEAAATVLMDVCIRVLPGVVGNMETHAQESFSCAEDSEFAGLLEYPLYTKPRVWKEHAVPDVLLSGNHGDIEKWRLKQAKDVTLYRRPDLL